MPDYEDMILQRQELQEIYEDDPEYIDNVLSDDKWWDELDPEVFQEWVFT